jgi:hypothetical protein
MSLTVASPISVYQNQARYFGVLPGANGQQIAEYDTQVNAGNTILYTVPTGYKLLLFNDWISGYFATSSWGFLEIWTDAPALAYRFAGVLSSPYAGVCAHSRFLPIHVEGDYTVRITSQAAALTVWGGFEGILIED